MLENIFCSVFYTQLATFTVTIGRATLYSPSQMYSCSSHLHKGVDLVACLCDANMALVWLRTDKKFEM